MVLDHSWHIILLHGVVGGLDDSILPIAALALGFTVLCFAAYGLMNHADRAASKTESECER